MIVQSKKLFRNRIAVSFGNFDREVLPGQVISGYRQKDDHQIQFFPINKEVDNIWWACNSDEPFEIGEVVNVRGPIGERTIYKDAKEKYLMMNFSYFDWIFQFAFQVGIQKGASIAFYAFDSIPDLPPVIEIVRGEDLMTSMDWADRILVAIEKEQYDPRSKIFSQLNQFSEKVDIFFPMQTLCDGQSECMVCAVNTRQGLVKSCKHGFLYEYTELEVL